MSVSLKNRVILWGRAANRCAFPTCRKELVVGEAWCGDQSLIGEACHIVAKRPTGARGSYALGRGQRDQYANLILLCREHHKLIDDQRRTYTVQRLQEMKAEHERWVSDSLKGFDPAKKSDDELYAEYIEGWVRRAGLNSWQVWSSWVLGHGQPSMSIARDRQIQDLRSWLLSRIWPGRYPELEAAFENFRCVLQDFQEKFREHAGERLGDKLWTEKFYQIDDWDPPRYERLSRQWDFHVALVEDLMLELTRAANYVCDRVRQFIDPTFRRREGVLAVVSGPYMDLTWKMDRVEYRGEERVLRPYPGLREFVKVRTNRDQHFGEGVSPDDPAARVGGNGT
jgi:hypothetical protein